MVSLIAPAVNWISIYSNQLRYPEVSNADSQAVSGKFLLLLQTFAGQVYPQPFYLQSGPTTLVPLPRWYLKVENRACGGNQSFPMVSNQMKRSVTGSVDQFSVSGDPVGGFKACRAWHEAITANSLRQRLAQTGERGG